MGKCKYCGGGVWKNGVDKGVQRFRCKECGRYFSDSLPKYGDKDKEKAIQMYLNNCGIRKTALFIGCSHATIINWVREAAVKIKEKSYSIDGDTIEMDEIFAQVDSRIPTSFKKSERT